MQFHDILFTFQLIVTITGINHKQPNHQKPPVNDQKLSETTSKQPQTTSKQPQMIE